MNASTSTTQIAPYGGRLVDLVVPAEQRDELRTYADRLPSLQISARAECDLELLAVGGFSPLDRFMGREDYRRVLDDMRLAGGQLFPIPVALPVDAEAAAYLDHDIALRNAKNELLAIMTVEEIYPWDADETAHKVLGTRDRRHPLASEMQRMGKLHVSGRLRVLRLPSHHDFRDLRLTPRQARERLAAVGRANVVAYQAHDVLHRADEEAAKRAIHEVDGTLLLHPVVGLTKPGDVDYYTRVRTYRVLAREYDDAGRILLGLLALATRSAGPREALWHAIIRRNYGANFLIVGRDYASPEPDTYGSSFYGPYDAQALLEQHSDELGVRPLRLPELVYLPDAERFEEVSKLAAAPRTATLPAAQLRDEYLARGRRLPAWFTRPEVARILSEAHPPRYRQGVCVWFTGLSGAGKSTIAEILTARLLEHGRQVTLLDGDVVRTHLSHGLGFSKQDRDINVRRIGFVAAEIARHGGIVVCAAISPYRATRNDVRAMTGADRFVEVFVDTPLQVCEQRDVKGMYAKARRGEIREFTGIDDPYEAPEHPEIRLDTSALSPDESAGRITGYLAERGYLSAP